MTAVGKLLVFLNLVFSLVVGAFAVMTYQSRAHLTDKYNKIAAQYSVAAGNAEAMTQRATNMAKERQDLNDKILSAAGAELQLNGNGEKAAEAMVARLKLQEKEIARLQGDLDKSKKDLLAKETAFQAAHDSSKISSKDVDASIANYRRVLEEYKAQLATSRNYLNQLNGTKDQLTAAEIDRDALKKKNVELVTRVASLEKENGSLKATAMLARAPGGGGAGARRPLRSVGTPPPANLEGRITRVANRNLVKISVGSDNGLSMDNELEVFRLGPTPKYLGKIKIVSLGSGEAVGQAMGRMAGVMQEGDLVAPTIMGGR